MPSDTLLCDLPYRGKCDKCGRWRELGVSIEGAPSSGGIPTEKVTIVKMEGERDEDVRPGPA